MDATEANRVFDIGTASNPRDLHNLILNEISSVAGGEHLGHGQPHKVMNTRQVVDAIRAALVALG